MLETEAKLVIQDRIRSGRINLAWSYMLEYENEKNPYKEKRRRISSWRNFAVVEILESEEIITQAEELVREGFKVHDSIHLACALSADCDIFVTTDKGILNRAAVVPKLAVLNPVDYDFD